ncbi:MAG: spermidine/putrescine ABC transporter substrate-binding protein [SAR324 cluster bacterium]|nr:spermidine/putrescine ABC transporter substrate-binding protein [SAR324 cluster bacterium]
MKEKWNWRSMAKMGVIVFLIIWIIGKDVQAAQIRQTLNFLNWSEYIDPEVVRKFEKKFDVKLKEFYFETDDDRDDILVQSDGKGYDLVLASGVAISPYLKHKWVSPVDRSKVPNIEHIDSRWLDAFSEVKGYGIPYFWGTVGIVYRSDLVSQKINSWKQLFHPSEDLRGKVLMIKDYRDTIGAALKSLGYSLNSENLKELDEAEKILLAQKAYVKKYSYLSLSEESALVTGEIAMAMAYNGDAVTLQDYHPQIEFVIPDEGSNLWVDYLLVMESSPRKELAWEFINFVNEPENAARLALYLNFATPNRSAKKFLSSEHLNDPVIYPSEKILSRSEFFKKLSPRVIRKMNSIFSKVEN